WFEAESLTQGVPGSSVCGAGSSNGPKYKKPPACAFGIFFGGESGVFENWADVQRNITGHGLAIYSGFPTVAAAEAALAYARARGWTSDSNVPAGTSMTPLPVPSSYEDNPLNSAYPSQLWYVVCRGVVPGVYRSYLECSLNSSGVRGNLVASFPTREAAEAAYTQALDGRWVRCIPRMRAI
ncbi:hypothetical protein C8R43DRAFT_910228, partial [Mycena crocata]